MDKYVIEAGAAWRLYHPMPVPAGWLILGTVRGENDLSAGALSRSPAGLYAQVNAVSVRILDRRAVAAALREVKLIDPSAK